MEYELLKAEIVALDDLRIALSHTQKFPDIGGKLDIILADMQRTAKRIHDLVNPDEGGMLVSEKVMPLKAGACVINTDYTEKADIWTTFENETYKVIINDDRTFKGGFCIVDKSVVIKKGEGNV